MQIEAAGLRDIERRLGATEEAGSAARQRAMARTLVWANTRIRRAVAREIGIKQKILAAKHRFRVKQIDRGDGEIWVGINRLNAIHFGPRQTKKGAKAGKRTWTGAFIARGRRGTDGELGAHKLVYQREGKRRLPVFVHKVDVAADARRAFSPSLLEGIEQQFMKTYMHELQRRLDRA